MFRMECAECECTTWRPPARPPYIAPQIICECEHSLWDHVYVLTNQKEAG